MTEKIEQQYRKVAVITGSSNVIGRSIAMEFAKSGYQIILNDVNLQILKETVQEVMSTIREQDESIANNISFHVGDISIQSYSRSLIEEIIGKFGKIDVLINIVTPTHFDPCNNINEVSTKQDLQSSTFTSYFTLEEYEIANTNLHGVYYCIKELVQEISKNTINNGAAEKKGNACSIINIAASYDSLTKAKAEEYTFMLSGIDPYTTSKEGIKTLTKTIALQLANLGVRINAISPGIIQEVLEERKINIMDKEKLNEIEKEIPFQRLGRVQEISKAALFLASDDANYITGTMIYVDGGLSLLHSNYFLEKDIAQD